MAFSEADFLQLSAFFGVVREGLTVTTPYREPSRPLWYRERESIICGKYSRILSFR